MLAMVVSLVMQGMLAAVYGSAQAMSVDVADGHRSFVICTSAGMRQITLNAQGDVISDTELPEKTVHCPICLAAHADLGLPEVLFKLQLPITGYTYDVTSITIAAFDRSPDDLHCLDPPLKA